jgi:hypothetical protein
VTRRQGCHLGCRPQASVRRRAAGGGVICQEGGGEEPPIRRGGEAEPLVVAQT